MADVHTPLQRSYNMSRISGKNTKPERLVKSLLREEGISYRSNVKTLPGQPDIIIRHLRIAVFVHGCFWHRHKGCRFTTNPKSNSAFWQQKFARTVTRDRENRRDLKKAGWTVMLVWECQAKLGSKLLIKKLRALAPASGIKRRTTPNIDHKNRS